MTDAAIDNLLTEIEEAFSFSATPSEYHPFDDILSRPLTDEERALLRPGYKERVLNSLYSKLENEGTVIINQ